MSQAAAVAVLPTNPVAALFNLDDPNERRIFHAIQTFYASDGWDRLHDMRRGTVVGPSGPVPMLWTLGSFHPQRRGAAVEWTVPYWHVDEIAVRFQRCPDEETARAVFRSATHPGAELPGLRMRKE